MVTKYNQRSTEVIPIAHREVEVRIDCIKEELIESIGTRRNVALDLATTAVSLQVGKEKKCNRGEAIVVGIDVYQPTIAAQENKQCHVQNQNRFFNTYPQCIAPIGMKKPLENPVIDAMTGERRSAFTGKAQMRAISRATHT